MAKIKTNINKCISDNEEKRKQRLHKAQTVTSNVKQTVHQLKNERLKQGEEDWNKISKPLDPNNTTNPNTSNNSNGNGSITCNNSPNMSTSSTGNGSNNVSINNPLTTSNINSSNSPLNSGNSLTSAT